jgi:hypothetical protein
MENPTSEESYKEAKRKAKAFYKTIGRVFCPALNDYVGFDTAGFHHLIWKQKKPRRKNEQMKRFTLLSNVKTIIASSATVTDHHTTVAHYDTYRRGSRKIVVSRADFWSFTGERNGKAVTVIVRQFKGGTKHFFSMFSK